jgi:hypothetical protein
VGLLECSLLGTVVGVIGVVVVLISLGWSVVSTV